MTPAIVIRPARPDDAEPAAAFAEVKRAEYARHSPVFWRPAADARAKHQPFLRFCIQSDQFAAFAAFTAEAETEADAEPGGAVVGVALANRHGAPAPFRADPEPTWFVDDFFVADSALWPTAGMALLAAVQQAASADEAVRVIVVVAQRDEPKRALLRSAGYALAAAWWVRPLVPEDAPIDSPAPPVPDGIEAVIMSAPPIYDPGGPVALALSLGSLGEAPTTRVARFDQWAAASGAALAVIPARVADVALGEALARAGYTIASEWYVRAVVEGEAGRKQRDDQRLKIGMISSTSELSAARASSNAVAGAPCDVGLTRSAAQC